VELKLLKGHTDKVNSVVFSSDGTWIMSGSYDMTVRVWDALTGTELNVLKGHTDRVSSVALLSDGTRIVSGSSDQSVRVWKVLTGVELKVLKGHTARDYSFMFSSDDTQIMSGLHDQSVQLSHIGHQHFVWNLADTNWIISSPGQDHLMWVPQEAQVTEPSNILIISCHGFGSVDFRQSIIGVDWVHCYTPQLQGTP